MWLFCNAQSLCFYVWLRTITFMYVHVCMFAYLPADATAMPSSHEEDDDYLVAVFTALCIFTSGQITLTTCKYA